MEETQVRSLGQEDPLEEEMATHSSISAWRIPWREEPCSPGVGKELDTTEWPSTSTLCARYTVALYFFFLNIRSTFFPVSTCLSQIFFFFFKIYLCILFFGCSGSLLLQEGFLWLQWVWAILCWGAWAFHCGGFSCCKAWTIGVGLQ